MVMSGEQSIVKVMRVRSGGRLPQRATPGAAGLDLHACLAEAKTMNIGCDPVLVPTGIAIELPPGHEAQIRPRSGLSLRGIMVAFGTVDCDYRGELLVTMYVVGSRSSYTISDGDRIAQLVITALIEPVIQEVAQLAPTARGKAGHGSTGI